MIPLFAASPAAHEILVQGAVYRADAIRDNCDRASKQVKSLTKLLAKEQALLAPSSLHYPILMLPEASGLSRLNPPDPGGIEEKTAKD